jgi:hypothetical protein
MKELSNFTISKGKKPKAESNMLSKLYYTKTATSKKIISDSYLFGWLLAL